MNREAIFNALAMRLEAVPGIRNFSRKLLHWSDVESDRQPALYMASANQAVTIDGYGLPPRLELPVRLYLYNQNQDPALQNNLLDAIERALEPDEGEVVLTLGGLVSHCWIEGEIETDEGLLGDQAVVIVPVSILVP
ncbi:MAG: DUF4872 domain-containing protein [Holophagaceae bacterium]|nr:DUF4872 domain-containing protein [Holophagaceae bacterium]